MAKAVELLESSDLSRPFLVLHLSNSLFHRESNLTHPVNFKDLHVDLIPHLPSDPRSTFTKDAFQRCFVFVWFYPKYKSQFHLRKDDTGNIMCDFDIFNGY